MITEQTYTLYVSDDFGITFKEICKFNKSNKPYREPVSTLGTRVKILNEANQEVNSYTLLPPEIKPISKFACLSDSKFALMD